MSEKEPIRELTCPTCGAPVKTMAPAGTTLKCDCCGATVIVPPAPEPAPSET